MAQVLHASYSGYFPFCLKSGTPPETGLGTDYPISLPLVQYMSWWWRVKIWSLSGSSGASETATDDNETQLSNVWTTTGLNQDTSWTSGISSETGLVCKTFRQIESIGFNGKSNIQEGDAKRELDFTSDWDISFFPDGYINNQTIYPRIRVSGWFDSLTPGDPKVQAQVDPYSIFSIDGVAIPCYIRWFPSWVVYANWAWAGSQSFTLNPGQFWGYQ